MQYFTEFKIGTDDLNKQLDDINTIEMPEGVVRSAVATILFIDPFDSSEYSATVEYSQVADNWSFKFPHVNAGRAPYGVVTVKQSVNLRNDMGVFSATATNVQYNTPATVAVDQSVTGQTKFTFGIPVGKEGVAGKDAYTHAVATGFQGSVTDWLESLRGVKGTDGVDGVDGKSAYELALQAGYKGSYLDWLNSLKGEKGDKGDQGKSAYQVAFDAGFSGTEAEWLESLKAPANPVGGGYTELASGVLWYCRPRYETRRFTQPDLGFGAYDYETAYYSEKFVIENSLYEDHGCYVVPQDSVLPQNNLRLRMTRGVNKGIHKAGRYTDDSTNMVPYSSSPGNFIDRWATNFKGWYYVMLSPADSAQFLSDNDLEKIEVDVQPTTFSGVNVTDWGVGGIETYHLAKEQGLLTPVYKGASRHIIHATGETIVALWFRVGVYTHRSNIGSDNHSFDGINGEPNGWNLHDVDVKFWSTNVAQGMKFSAKIRK